MPTVKRSTDQPAGRAVAKRGRPPGGARERLIQAMRELLMKHDFEAIATEDVLTRAGVSRGGMYHHFQSKLELFRAAYVASEREVIQRLGAVAAARAAQGASPFEQLLAGSIAYVRECAAGGEFTRIGLRQSRAVLGWEGWRDAAGPLGIGAFRLGVQAAVESGEIVSTDIAVTTHLLLAALIEGGLLAATSEEPEKALTGIEAEVTRMLTGLRVHPPSEPPVR